MFCDCRVHARAAHRHARVLHPEEIHTRRAVARVGQVDVDVHARRPRAVGRRAAAGRGLWIGGDSEQERAVVAPLDAAQPPRRRERGQRRLAQRAGLRRLARAGSAPLSGQHLHGGAPSLHRPICHRPRHRPWLVLRGWHPGLVVARLLLRVGRVAGDRGAEAAEAAEVGVYGVAAFDTRVVEAR